MLNGARSRTPRIHESLPEMLRLSALYREIQARERELDAKEGAFEAMVMDIAKKMGVSKERVCEMIGESYAN